MAERQYVLDIPHRAALTRADFVAAPANAAALGWIEGWPDWPASVALGFGAAALGFGDDCLRACRCAGADGFGLAAAAAATPGRTGPVGSGFMMLTAGIEEALGKSILTILREPCPAAAAVDPVGACVASAGGTSGALQAAA